jgi:hypothetical protein
MKLAPPRGLIAGARAATRAQPRARAAKRGRAQALRRSPRVVIVIDIDARALRFLCALKFPLS